MTSLKTLLFGTTLAAGAAFFMGTTAHADEAYTVQSGDTLSTISQKYVGDNSLINAIAESNSISDINLIYSGQQLTIPTEGSTQAAAEPQAAVQEAQSKLNLFKLNNLLYKKRFKRKHKQPLLLKHNLLQQKQRQQARMLQKNGSHKKNQAVLTQQRTDVTSDVTN